LPARDVYAGGYGHALSSSNTGATKSVAGSLTLPILVRRPNTLSGNGRRQVVRLHTEASSPTTAGKPLATISISDEPSPVFLRREGPDDRAAIFAIHAAAFARPDGLVAPEAHLVDGLRDDGDIVPALDRRREQQ
jgi:hypothetical protein